jgi:hypothetical protein
MPGRTSDGIKNRFHLLDCAKTSRVNSKVKQEVKATVSQTSEQTLVSLSSTSLESSFENQQQQLLVQPLTVVNPITVQERKLNPNLLNNQGVFNEEIIHTNFFEESLETQQSIETKVFIMMRIVKT